MQRSMAQRAVRARIGRMRTLISCCLALLLLPWPAYADDAVLVFTRTAKFRHDSIPVAVDTLASLAAEQGLRVVHGEDSGVFTAEGLSAFRAVVFANTTGDVLDEPQQAALQAFIEGGGGFLGLHSAADTEYDWPFYGELVGAWFHKHPPGLQSARVTLHGQGHEGVQRSITDEIYNYRRNPRPWVQVLATVDEAGYEGGTMGDDHPITWCRPMGRGRSWYTGFGHDAAVYADPDVRAMLRRGLAYASGASPRC